MYFISVIKYFLLILVVCFCFGCSISHNVNIEQNQDDVVNTEKYDPFMHHSTKVAPMFSKTIVLPEKKKAEQQEQETAK